MREAREKAEKDAAQQQGKEEKPQEKGQPEKQYKVDFSVKDTGQKKQLAGYDTHEVIMTVTVREKGKTLEDGGGLVMNVDSWLGPHIPAMKEAAEFDLKYWKQLQGPDAMGMSAEQMATVMAMYPAIKQAAERLQKESPKLQGTPLATTTTVEGVKSKEEVGGGRAQLGVAEIRRRPGRHARSENGEEGRYANTSARDDFHRGTRSSRKFRRRSPRQI